MIPKEEQLDLGTQPRYTRQWGYNASTGSTSMFRRFADVFNSGAKEETRLRNQLRMRIGQGIADQYVDLAAKHHVQDMGKDAKAYFGDDLASWSPDGRMTFHDRRPSTVKYEHVGGFDDVATTNINYNKNYADKTPTEGIGEPDTDNPAKKSTRTTKRTVSNPKTKKTPSKTKVEPAEDEIKDAEIIEDEPTDKPTSEPTTRIIPADTAQKKTRTDRPGRQGAEAEDPDASAKRKNKPTKPDDLTLQGN